ncbi:WAS/WASL-interacting protein family member 3-like isoform X2 [Salmo trutta]|uniref:WAS/WASL-interacting protein family member 3-like isoform X2 n=1 Tax=Salmo trutta TaxID=8032 RepID=UPI0011324C43|nr:WAS/WASL-interacting protein family member 3-like isoform X2 [Salmo trutta]
MDETIDASAGAPAGTTPDSCITIASVSQCATPVGAAGVPSCRRRPLAYSPDYRRPLNPNITPAPPSHRQRFRPPPRCTPPPRLSPVTRPTLDQLPPVSPGHTTIAALSGVPAIQIQPPPQSTAPALKHRKEKSSTGHLCHTIHGTTLRRHHLLCSLRRA